MVDDDDGGEKKRSDHDHHRIMASVCSIFLWIFIAFFNRQHLFFFFFFLHFLIMMNMQITFRFFWWKNENSYLAKKWPFLARKKFFWFSNLFGHLEFQNLKVFIWLHHLLTFFKRILNRNLPPPDLNHYLIGFQRNDYHFLKCYPIFFHYFNLCRD